MKMGMKIEQNIEALRVLRNKLRVLHVPKIEYRLEYGRLFEGILTEHDEGVFLESLEKKKILKLDTAYGETSSKRPAVIGRGIEIDVNRFNDCLRETDKKLLGEIGKFKPEQEQAEPILHKEVLKKIAEEIDTASYWNEYDFRDFLASCSIDRRFLYEPLYGLFSTIYPCGVYSAANIYNTLCNPAPKLDIPKEKDVPNYKKGRCWKLFRILAYYSYSKNRNQRILFNIIEKSVALSSLNADKEHAEKFENTLSEYLAYDGYTLEKGKIKKVTLASLDNQKDTSTIPSVKVRVLRLKSGDLVINKNSGAVTLNEVSSKINPTGQELKILLRLAESEDYTATYAELLSKENPSKSDKRVLSFTVRNIKGTLGILPKKNRANKDIIQNIKGHGYGLIT